MIDSGLRLRLILGKFRVVRIYYNQTGKHATIELQHGYQMTINHIPESGDLRPGDLITFYGEIPTNASSHPTPKQ